GSPHLGIGEMRHSLCRRSLAPRGATTCCLWPPFGSGSRFLRVFLLMLLREKRGVLAASRDTPLRQGPAQDPGLCHLACLNEVTSPSLPARQSVVVSLGAVPAWSVVPPPVE